MGLSANCPANCLGLRRRHRQGRGTPDSWKILRARARIWRSVLAHLSRPGEGQSVEHRPVSLRIAEPTNALGAGGYGPVHSPYHRIWHSPRNCRWAVTVLDVAASDSRASVAEVSQHGQRSVVSVPPMAGQPASVGGDGNQDGTLRATIASLCGAACWNAKERVPGSNIILDNRRPGGEAASVSEVFQ